MSEMFLNPPTEAETRNNSKVNHKFNKRKRKKNAGGRNGGKINKKHGKLALTMSAWAENFTFAATWQLKHQLAYWKARAKALEYENGVLHDIIRRKNYIGPSDSNGFVDPECSTQIESEPEEEYEEEEGGEDFEVSEEFIQFLQANAKYKEDARRERERLKAQNSEKELIEEMEAGPSECKENTEEIQKDLYGDKWQTISALEMSLQSNFINETDKDKPMYWPNIPFNFNFG